MARYPRPLKAKLLCPLGKLLHPSCRIWWSVSWQTSIETSPCLGVSSLCFANQQDRGVREKVKSHRSAAGNQIWPWPAYRVFDNGCNESCHNETIDSSAMMLIIPKTRSPMPNEERQKRHMCLVPSWL